jgi:hypothetical protein
MGGRGGPGSSTWTYNGYARTGTPGSFRAATSTEPTDNEALSEALARTNPNRTKVDGLVFLAELRDIPRLLQYFAHIGFKAFRDRPIRSIAEAYLTYEYGVAAMMSDVVKTLDFVNHTEKRFRELKNLQSSKNGLGRIWTVWRDSNPGTPTNIVATGLYNEGNTVQYQVTTDRRKWVSTRWIPQVDLSSFTDDQLRNRANRAVFGTDLSFATLWEVMPWSWLIDWFSNVGDIASLSRNTIPVKHDGSCVMLKTVHRMQSAKIVSGPGLLTAHVKSGHGQRISLRRTPMVFGPLPEFNLPFLNGKQLSILSALTVLKFGPKG